MWASLREKNSRGAVLEGTPHLCEFCLQEPYQILTVKIRENALAALPILQSGAGEKEPSRNRSECSVLLNMASP